MPEVTVIYNAPKGDEKVVEMFGQTFFDGQPQEIDLPTAQVKKLRGNRHFEVSGDPADDGEVSESAPTTVADEGNPANLANPARRRGRPPKIHE